MTGLSRVFLRFRARRVVARVALVAMLASVPSARASLREPTSDLVVTLARTAAGAGGGPMLLDPALSPRGARTLGVGDRVGRGQLVFAGQHGVVRVLLGGHTLVEAGPGGLFAVRPSASDPGRRERRIEIVAALAGTVRLVQDRRYLPVATRVVVQCGRSKTLPVGQGVVEAATGRAAWRGRGVDVARAVALARRPVAFSERLYGLGASSSPGVPDLPARARARLTGAQLAPDRSAKAWMDALARDPGLLNVLDLERRARRRAQKDARRLVTGEKGRL